MCICGGRRQLEGSFWCRTAHRALETGHCFGGAVLLQIFSQPHSESCSYVYHASKLQEFQVLLGVF